MQEVFDQRDVIMHDNLINPAPFCHRVRIVDIIFSVVCRSDCKTWRYRAHLVLVELRTERNNGRRNVFAAHGVLAVIRWLFTLPYSFR